MADIGKDVHDMTSEEMDLPVEEGKRYYGEYGAGILGLRVKIEQQTRAGGPFVESVRRFVKKWRESRGETP